MDRTAQARDILERNEDVSPPRSSRFLREHRAGHPWWQRENPRLWSARLPCSASRTRKGHLPEGPGLLLRRHNRRSRGVPPMRSLHARLLSGGRAGRPISADAEPSLGPESLTRDRWNRDSRCDGPRVGARPRAARWPPRLEVVHRLVVELDVRRCRVRCSNVLRTVLQGELARQCHLSHGGRALTAAAASFDQRCPVEQRLERVDRAVDPVVQITPLGEPGWNGRRQ